MNTYTYSEARQNLSAILDKAKKDGKVLIKRKDGSLFELKALIKSKSPLNVKGVNAAINKEDIIDILKEVRER
ncbi:MAG: type II toxin-antitoxin system Phd/YefM family antitoxin [Ignavibacteriae bacterium]|nr:type II toxin-antitoxin system Phd/YefM family antitoxin [Ignavibacteriota bacterium]NOG97281.1 type II toxin-antitoxin system Phd/YefM family antitoxin [Ignavibacteriota bacterium]